MVNFVMPKLPFLGNLSPLNPYIITATAVLISTVSLLSYHYCSRDTSVVIPSAGAEISIKIPKAFLPVEDIINKTDELETISHANITVDIPKEFDARTEWPNCSDVIGKVWDQGTCQSCWAVSAASVMSDRICIRSNGTSKPILSPQHLICYCKNCTKYNDPVLPMYKCMGGDSEAAWEFWRDEGLVTGGDYGTNDTCMPYLSKPCIHNPRQAPGGGLAQCGYNIDFFICPVKCNNSETSIGAEEKYKGAKIYYIENTETDIQKEIMMYGPVQAKFTFDEKPLMQYTGGLFSCPNNTVTENHIHSIKIIGWGVQDETPYWLCINSYNSDWGEKGTFKIQRGVNMYLIEESVMAGLPDLEQWSRLGPGIV